MNVLAIKNKSLVEYLKNSALTEEKGITYIYGENDEKSVKYENLLDSGAKVLDILQKRGIKKGDKLIMQVDKLEDFVNVFWACILGGIIPVPITVANSDENRNKLSKINGVLEDAYYISSKANIRNIKEFSVKENLYELKDLVDNRSIYIDDIYNSGVSGIIYDASPDDIAFIQFSSGSTGDSKGVVLTHENLLTNITAMIKCGEFSERDTMLSWMPLTHDMGIIGFHLLPLVLNINHYILPTELFMRRPTVWLKKASEHKISVLGSSNFGYKHVLKTVKDNVNYDWNLSNVRLIFTGAEHISAKLCSDFVDKMKQFGIKRNIIFTVYGLAEASLGVTFPLPGKEVKKINLCRESINIGQKIIEVAEDCSDSIQFVEVGQSIDDCFVRICDEENNVLDDRTVGYIHIKGKNVTKGYYNNDEENNRNITKDGWLNTRDIGFLRSDSLVVVGRSREMILCDGKTLYPHDIENIAEEIEEIDLGMVAAVGVYNDDDHANQDVVLFIRYKKSMETFLPLALKLENHIFKKIMVKIKQVIPIKQMPKTTSGKIQRYKFIEKYESGEFTDIINCVGN